MAVRGTPSNAVTFKVAHFIHYPIYTAGTALPTTHSVLGDCVA